MQTTEKETIDAQEHEATHPLPTESAKEAHLRYVNDSTPGIRRIRSGKGFRYVGSDGTKITDPDVLARIAALAIPPAWENVWISPHPNGHLQATGKDVKGRKQYRYHPRWRRVRDETKYDRMILFGEILPSIRRRIEEDLALPGLPRQKILATALQLLDRTLIRIGNQEYARENRSFGLTTMWNRHVHLDGSTLRFSFRGKSGVHHTIELHDRRLARIVGRCRELPGHELFQYLDEKGESHSITSGDVNDYLREISGHEITAKDFRTWGGTVHAAQALVDLPPGETEEERNAAITQAVERAAEMLGNTPAICRKCYIHPAIFESYRDGSMSSIGKRGSRSATALRAEERWVLRLLRKGSKG